MIHTSAVVFHPVETNEPLKNPYKGWVFIDHAVPGQMDAAKSVGEVQDGTPYEWYENVAVLSTWAHVEPKPDTFDWSLMDECIATWASLGKRIHLRFSTEDFNIIPGCPRWLFDMGVPATKREHRLFPDYTHPLYLERLGKFLAAFAEKFAQDPRIETVNLQGYGDFGEWHSGADYETVEMRVKALRGIVDQWRKAFAGKKILNLSCSYEWMTRHNVGMDVHPLGTSIYEEFLPSYRDYLYRSAFDYAYKFPDVTLARHGCAGAVKQEYDGRLIATFFQHWRKPMFMEFFGSIRDYTGPSIVGFADTKSGDDHVSNAMDELLSHHPTYATPLGWGAGGAGPADASATVFYNRYRDLMLQTLNLMGYRFVLVEAKFPEKVAPGAEWVLYHSWENRAMGRCYKPFPLAVYLMDGERIVWSDVDKRFDQTAFVSGETYNFVSRFRLPVGIGPNIYDLRIGMVDSTGKPALNLAIAGNDGSKRYRIGTIAVMPNRETPLETDKSLNVSKKGSCWIGEKTFPSNTTCVITFQYEIVRDPERDLDTDDTGFYRFYVEGEDGSRLDEVRWYDKAGQSPAWKTVLVNTLSAKSYVAKWEAVGGGDLSVKDVRYEVVPAERVRKIDLRGKQIVLKGGARLEQQTRVVATRDRTQVRLPDDWYDFLETVPDVLPLKRNTTYTVWFNSATRPQVWQADYHYLSVRTAAGGLKAQRGFWRWTQRFTHNPVRHAYTFTTGPYDDYRLVWGIHNGGENRISQITLVER